MYRHRTYEPTSSEAQAWRDFASLCRDIAHGRSHAWSLLRQRGRLCRSCRVFGQGGEGNVCQILIETAETVAMSSDPHAHFEEFARLAGEVLKRAEAYFAVRREARRA